MADHGHAKLSPSQAKRWINCPGSVALSLKAPKQAPSKYAAEGTVAHSLAEEFVTGKLDSLSMMEKIGTSKMQEGFEIEITEEMFDGAVEYHDVIKADRQMLESTPKPMKVVGEAEKKVCASSVDKDLWGTADYLLYRKGDTLFVHDYKYGAGVIVDPEENEQAMIYAIAAMDELGWAFSKVVIKIVQPRGRHEDGTTREWSPSIERLTEFRDSLKLAVAATRQENAPLKAGDHCRWCPAKPFCPVVRGAAQESAMVDFDVVVPEVVSAAQKLQEVRLLPIARVAKILEWEPMLKSLIEAVKDVVREKLSAGEEVPGWKLVDGREGNRQWVSEDQVVAEFAPVLGADKLYEKKLLSPAKIEKLVGKKHPIAHLTYRAPGEKAIARATDPRPVAASSAQDAFDVVGALPEDDLMSQLGAAPTKREPMWPVQKEKKRTWLKSNG